MSVTIRLRRMGRNNLPFYRVVAADTRRSNQGRYIEALGWYDPGRDGECSLKMDRIEYWTSQGALVSDTVKNLISRQRKKPTAPKPAKPEKTAKPEAPAESEKVEEPPPAEEPAASEPSSDKE